MRTSVGRLVASAAIVVAVAIALTAILVGLRPFDPVRTEVVQADLDHPWDIAFAADGRMLVTERIGRVRVFAGAGPGAALLHTQAVPDVRADLESGLMGIAVAGNRVFVCASIDDGDGWHVAVLRSELAADGTLAPFEPMPIGEITGGPRHQGCAVEVDPDDHLWVSVGDANLARRRKSGAGPRSAQRQGPARERRRLAGGGQPDRRQPGVQPRASQPTGHRPARRRAGRRGRARDR